MLRPSGPPPRGKTIRDDLARVLREGWTTTLELSSAVGIPEKAVPDHLEHLRRSLAAAGERLEVDPARCSACGFVFRQRERVSRPSRCPACKSERIEPPRFRLGGD